MLTIDSFERPWRGIPIMLFADWIDAYCKYLKNGSNILWEAWEGFTVEVTLDNFKVPTVWEEY